MKSLPNTIHKTVVAEEINTAHILLKKIEKFGVETVAEAEKRSQSSLWELKRRAKAGKPLFDRRHMNPVQRVLWTKSGSVDSLFPFRPSGRSSCCGLSGIEQGCR